MRKLSIFVLCTMLMIGCLGLPDSTLSAAPVRSPNAEARNRIYWEALRAITPYYQCPCPYKIDGNTVSEWNYLASDPASYALVKSWYNACSSSFWLYGDPPGCGGWTSKYPSFYSNLSSYGLQYNSKAGGFVGRGGQCKYFVNLLLYRSGADTSTMRSYADMARYTTQIKNATPGDVIFSTGHIAIVLSTTWSNGQFLGAGVIDSNYVGGKGEEIIATHWMNLSQLSGYSVYTGVSYY